MSTIAEVLEIRNKYDTLQKQNEELLREMKTIFNNIDLGEYELLDYEKCKDIYDKVLYRVEDYTRDKLNEILTKKKEVVYPQILKAHYYPELNTLEIPDNNKVEIDSYIRHHIRHIFTERLIGECNSLSENIEALTDLGIFQKVYSFKCYECGGSSESLSQEELNGYKRIWEIEAIIKDKGYTDELDKELDDLYMDHSYGCIELYCMECDEMHKEIANLNQFEEYVNEGHLEIYYKIVKNPDLTYEKL